MSQQRPGHKSAAIAFEAGQPGRPFFTLLSVVALLLAGCAAKPPTALDEFPKLADFEKCNSRYIKDDKPIPCEDHAIKIEQHDGQPPLPWYCYRDYKLDERWAFRHCTSPTGEWAFAYTMEPRAWAKEGLARINVRGSDEPLLYRWDITSSTGYIVIPNADEAGSGTIAIYGLDFNATPEWLAQGEVEELWTPDPQGVGWLIYRIRANGHDYFFDAMKPHPATGNPIPDGAWVEGSDFSVNLTYLGTSLGVQVIAVGPGGVSEARAAALASSR